MKLKLSCLKDVGKKYMYSKTWSQLTIIIDFAVIYCIVFKIKLCHLFPMQLLRIVEVLVSFLKLY